MTAPPTPRAGFSDPRDGRWVVVRLQANTLTDARRERDTLIVARRENRASRRSTLTLNDLARDYLDSIEGSLRPSTCRHYRYVADQYVLPYLGTRKLTDLDSRDIASWLQRLRAKGLSEWTRQNAYTVARNMFKLARARSLIVVLPTDGLLEA